MSMTLTEFTRLSDRDFQNGAVLDEIATVFKERNQLQDELKRIHSHGSSPLANGTASQEFFNVECLGLQISPDSQRVWVCVNGQSVLRAKGIGLLEIQDDRMLSETDETTKSEPSAT